MTTNQSFTKNQPIMAEVEEKVESVSQRPPSIQGQNAQGEDEFINPVYANDEEEPELTFRTYIALASVFLLLFGQGLAFQGPPSGLSHIAADLGNPKGYTWIANAPLLVQAVFGPVVSFASDIFQARKNVLIVSCTLAFIGCAIVPGANGLATVVGADVMIGFGFAAVPVSFVVPSEILPRKWRPMAQAFCGVAASSSGVTGPLILGALIKANPHEGWRRFYWIMFAIFAGAALGLFFGYRPPKRHTRLDNLSFFQKLGHCDIPGILLMTVGLTLFSFGISVGGDVWAWKSATTLSTIIIGGIFLALFGLYEWKGTSNGLLNHDLFQGGKSRGRLFAICIGLMGVEGVLVFPFVIFYSIWSNILYTTDPIDVAVRLAPYWGFFFLSCPLWGYAAVRLRSIREPLFVGFVFLIAANVGMATLQPGQSGANQMIFAGLGGIGFGCPLVLVIAGVQLAAPHRLIATATAVANTSRAVVGVIFTAAYTVALSNNLHKKLPTYIAQAAGVSGLPASSIPAFIAALAGGNHAALAIIPGATPEIIEQGVLALKHAYADSLRVIYIIAAPFGLLACIACCFMGNLKWTMTYRVDAPIEELHAKHQVPRNEKTVA